MEAVGSFKTCVTFGQITRRRVPKHSTFIVMAVKSWSHKASYFRLAKGKQFQRAKEITFIHKRITRDCWPTCWYNRCQPTADLILLQCWNFKCHEHLKTQYLLQYI